MTTNPAAEPTGIHDAPTAAELLAVVGDYLRDEVIPAARGEARFNARVAANVVAMVGRELQQPATVGDHIMARITQLGYADEAALAAGIRAGELDENFVELHAVLRELVAAKLQVANPTYIGDMS